MTDPSEQTSANTTGETGCLPCAPTEGASPGLSGFGFKIGISLALAGQGMVFGLGYNNALKAGEDS